MHGTYDPWLVGLSIGVAVIAAYVALDLVSRVVASRKTKAARYWLLGATADARQRWALRPPLCNEQPEPDRENKHRPGLPATRSVRWYTNASPAYRGFSIRSTAPIVTRGPRQPGASSSIGP